MCGRDNDWSLPGGKSRFLWSWGGGFLPSVNNVVAGTFFLEPSRLNEREPPLFPVKVTVPACV